MWILKKALYKLKQEPHAWHSKSDEYLLGLGFTKTVEDPNFYYLFDRFDMLVLVMYVDDLILTRSSVNLITRCKFELE